jgi:hypothetical protein
MSIKTRDVLLFGPEVTQPWKAPTTDELTKLILNKGFRKRDNTTITSLVYKKLSERIEKKKVTYESILHFIDQLYNYSTIRKKIRSYIHVQEEVEQEAYSLDEAERDINFYTEFTVADINDAAGTYSMIIPGYLKLKEYNIPRTIPPIEKYFELLYAELANIITDAVSRYSYHTEGRDLIFTKENEEINALFTRFVTRNLEFASIRMYSLGYDRIFKVLLSKAGIPVFEGYDVEESYVKYNEQLSPNIRKIALDKECNCFYNLHGCAYWKIETVKSRPYSMHYFTLTPGVNKQESTISIDTLGDKRMIASNILTAHHASQKNILTPYRQMYAALDRDMLECRNIYLIGYKFDDEQINTTLRLVRQLRPKASITLVDDALDEKNEMLEFLMNWNAPKKYNYLANIRMGSGMSGDMKFHIVTNSFEKFMKSMI